MSLGILFFLSTQPNDTVIKALTLQWKLYVILKPSPEHFVFQVSLSKPSQTFSYYWHHCTVRSFWDFALCLVAQCPILCREFILSLYAFQSLVNFSVNKCKQIPVKVWAVKRYQQTTCFSFCFLSVDNHKSCFLLWLGYSGFALRAMDRTGWCETAEETVISVHWSTPLSAKSKHAGNLVKRVFCITGREVISKLKQAHNSHRGNKGLLRSNL